MRILSRLSLLWVFFFLLGIQTSNSQTTAITSQSGFAIESDGNSTLGVAALQSGSDIRFGSSSPNFTIGEGHDILLGRSLGPDEAKLRIALKSPDSLSLSELTGDWRLYEYEVDEEDGNTFSTFSGAISFQSGGNVLLDGSLAGTLSINASQDAILTTDDEDDPIEFTVNAFKDLMVASPSEPGIHSLLILIRAESGGTTSQMAGTWTLGSFGADFSMDPPDIWYDGDTLTAAANGSVDISGESANWAADGSGNITFTDAEASTTLSVSQSRNALAYTKTLGDLPDQTHGGAIILRHASTPSIASLAGDWTLHTFEISSSDINDPNLVETYHPDTDILQRRERYFEGQLHGSPAVEEWNLQSNPTLVEYHTNGLLTYSSAKTYQPDGIALSTVSEQAFDSNGAITAATDTSYHADGTTVSERITTTTVDGATHVRTVNTHANGNKTRDYSTVDGVLDGSDTQWDGTTGKLSSRTTYSLGRILAETFHAYYPGGHTQRDLSYAGGNTTEVAKRFSEGGVLLESRSLRNGKLHGPFLSYDANGILSREENYDRDIRHGPSRTWYPGSTQLASEGTYYFGKYDGLVETWHANGSKNLQETYTDGIKNGQAYQYDNQGRKVGAKLWDYGKLRRLEDWSYYEDGTPSGYNLRQSSTRDIFASVSNFETVDLHRSTNWDEDGNLSIEAEKQYGKLEYERVYAEGTLVSDEEYSQGLRHGYSRLYTSGNPDLADGTLLEESQYRYDQLHGTSIGYHQETGELVARINYQYDLLDGLSETFFKNGEKKSHGSYTKDLADGLHSTWTQSTPDTPSILQTKITYKDDILDGPWTSYHENGEIKLDGQYADGLKDRLWTTYDEDGKITLTEEYSDDYLDGERVSYFDNESVKERSNYSGGFLDGTFETYHDNPSYYLYSTTEYTDGFETGPRETFYANGQTKTEIPLEDGRIHGKARSYHDNGIRSGETDYVDGLPDGSTATYRPSGVIQTRGSYYRGAICGAWTNYDEEGAIASTTDNGPCAGGSDPAIVRGIKGNITVDGEGFPGATISLYDPIRDESYSATSRANGDYILSVTDDSTSFILTVSYPGYPNTTETIEIPNEHKHVTNSPSLTPYDPPTISLGAPSVSGTHFIEGVALPVHIPGTIDWKDAPVGVVDWKVGDDNTTLTPDDPWEGIQIYPGTQLSPGDPTSTVIARLPDGQKSSPTSLPNFQIHRNPEWAQKIGEWRALSLDDGGPGIYQLHKSWPPDGPIDFGIKRESVSPEKWVVWQLVPIIGGEDFGLFNTFIEINASTFTDGSPGSVELEANGDLRFGLSLPALPVGLALKSRLNAQGSGTLNWGETLSLDSASIKLSKESEGKIIFKPTSLLKKYGINFEWLNPLGTFGPQFSELINIIEFEVSYGASFNGDISLIAGKSSLEILTASAEKRASLAADLDSYLKELELGIKGEAFVNVIYTDSLSSSINIGSTVEINGRIVLDDVPLLSFTIPEEPNPSSSDGTFSNKPRFVPASYSGLNDYAKFNSRSSIEVFSSDTVVTSSETDALPIVSNVYPYAEPTLAEFEGTRAIAYIHFDPNRPEGQSTRLYYSIDSGSGFATPKAVHNQARSDFDPEIAYLPDGRLLALWKTSQVDQISPTLDERLAGSEIAWSLYDSNSDNWSEPTLLTYNTNIDHRLSIASSTGGLMAVWHSNVSNAYISDNDHPDTINFARWNGSSFENPSTLGYKLPTMGNVSVAYDGTHADLAWIQDIDGDFATTEDIELYRATYDGVSWSEPERLTSDSLIDAQPTLLCLDEGAFETIWLKDGRLVRMASEETLTYENVFTSIQADGSTNYSVSCTANGDIALVWAEYVGTQHDLLFSYYDSLSTQWSEPIQLTDDFELERASAFTLDDNGNLLAAYLREHTDTEQRDLHWLECELGIDLAVTSVSVEAMDDAPGQFELKASVENLGALPSGGSKLTFHLGDPDNGGAYLGELAVNLNGGEKAELVYQSGALSAGTVYARIDPDNTVEELDESNNTASSNLNPVDLEANYLTWDRSVSDESTLTLKGTIVNHGRATQTNIPVTIRDASGALFTTILTSLEPGESTSVETTLAAPSENKYRYTLVVDPDNTLGEPDRSDNEFPLIVSLAKLKDSDGDGMENAWEELNFGTLDRDGRGDFDGDGLTDSFEYLTQNDPNDPKSKFPFTIESHPTDASKVLIRFPTIAGNIYRIQRSSDFINWTNDSFHLGTGDTLSVSASRQSGPLDPESRLSGFRVSVSLE